MRAGQRAKPDRADDEVRLQMLHLKAQGMSHRAIARRLGVRPGRVAGGLNAVREAEAVAYSQAVAAGTAALWTNGDGSMPVRWWAAEVVA